MLDNVGLRYPHRASGTKAPRTLRPLPLLRFAVSATGGAHLCSIQYYLRFWLGICRTSLAVSALRIVRYCLIFTAGHRIVPCRFYMYPIVYHVLHDKSIFHRQIRNSYTCPGKFCWNGARAFFFGGCFPLPGCKFNQRIKANPAKQKVPSPQRYCRSGTS